MSASFSDASEPRIVPAEDLSPDSVDQDALRVISRLHRNGFEAYLVGGCVRDLLLGRTPKDFDVATAAHPRQIRRLFRNGRIIGRRFRLVHVVYGRSVIETATFRREPNGGAGEDDDLLIVEDNEYGTAAEDARRRDFTVNGLFLEPRQGTWRIHDFVGGLEDLDRRVLRTIGTPSVRFAEDPVRILRAIKFATRLGFRIGDETWSAMAELAPELSRSAPPRVLEEILRLLRSGTALGAFRMLRACGALATLLPAVDEYLGRRDDPDPEAHDRADSYWRLLEALDADVHRGNKPSTPVLLAVLILRLLERQGPLDESTPLPAPVREGAELHAAAGDLLDPLATPARLSRRLVERAKRIVADQRRFTQASSKNRSSLRFLMTDDFPDALHLFGLRSAAWGQGWDVYEGWVERFERVRDMPSEELEELRSKSRRRRRRRRRKNTG